MTLCLGLLFNYFPVSFSGFFLEEDRGLMFFFSKSKVFYGKQDFVCG